MNRSELLDSVRDKTGLTKKQIGQTLDAILESIEEAVANGEKVTLVGFGTFEALEKPERLGRNPRTGEPMTIPPKTMPRFKAGKPFQERMASSVG